MPPTKVAVAESAERRMALAMQRGVVCNFIGSSGFRDKKGLHAKRTAPIKVGLRRAVNT